MSRLILAAALVATVLVSCEKTGSIFLSNQTNNCQVKQIVYSQCCGITETLLFTYNHLGDPVSIKQLPGPHTGAPDYVFRYDKQNRLSEMIGFYQDGHGGEFYHKYFYAKPGNSNIILDSVYYFPLFENNTLVDYQSAVAIHLSYDRWGRIIKDSSVYENGISTVVKSYRYNANGNLDGRNYDDKMNIHQTNSVWMFLDRDYSVNNPFSATAYNSHGLPTIVSLPGESGSFFKFVTDMRTADITYACRGDH